MEFSLFLVLLALVFSVPVLAVNGAMTAAARWKTVRYALFAVPAIVFLFSRETAVLLSALVLAFVLVKDAAFFRKSRVWFLALFFPALLAATGLIFYREMTGAWIAIGDLAIKSLATVPLLRNSRFSDVFFVAQYFRSLYPVLAAVLLFFLFDRILSGHRKTYWRRFFRKFDHRMVYPTVFFWTAYFTLEWFKPAMFQPQGMWLNLALETAVFFSALYAVYGSLTVAAAFRKFRVPLAWSAAGLALIVVFSGPVFLFTLTFLMGIGVSDIWMHYNKKRLNKAFSK